MDHNDEILVDEVIIVAAPQERVWAAIVDANDRAGWWSYLDLEPTVGGRLEEQWAGTDGTPQLAHGVVLHVVTDELLRWTWAEAGQPPTHVEIRLEPENPGTRVRVSETGWERLANGAERAAANREGWRMHLRNLRRHVELG
ncbi:SRPBCC family protein [Micromonospora sp. H33]|uniref:SRPBCC family protein n=1 Tax=Micromonospora sp. H33 TaxID=3452215 RepID=UPI003F89695D